MKKNKFYITTSIAYANASPHIGFALESLQADVLARYRRELGEDVFFLTGTDEHGIKIKKAAELAKKSPQEFVDEISEKFKNLKPALNLSNDDFIRTTEERHRITAEKVWLELKKNKDIYKKKYKGLYCSGCEAFITEKSLVDGKCPLHKKEPELVEEENYFFRVSKYLAKIKKAIEKDAIKIIPETRKNEVLGEINAGFEDVSFSRAKEKYWGFEVPGDKSQIIYVWGDALLNYISAIGYSDDPKKFKKLWPADVHFIGKDILKFHAIIWPAMLLSLGLKLPKIIFVHGFITVDSQKMSKSLGNVVDPFELAGKYGVDPVRYYLLREIPATEDGDFSFEKFEQRYNSDLASGIGNLTARVLTMAENKLKTQNSKLPPAFAMPKASRAGKTTTQNLKLNEKIIEIKNECKSALENFKFNEALKAVWDLIGFCDKYIEQEKPWEGKKGDVISDLLVALKNIAELLAPFLPGTSEKILKQIETQKSVPLFPRIQK